VSVFNASQFLMRVYL